MEMGYVKDMMKTLEIAADFMRGGGVRWCPECGTELGLNPIDPWHNGVQCPACGNTYSWQHWTYLSEKWCWDNGNTGLVSFHGDEVDVEVPHHCTRIYSYAFSNSNAVSVQVPDSVTVIEPFAFCNNSHLKSVVLPDGLQRIEEGTFLGCENLLQVSIPRTVKYIGKNAFSGCTSLKKVTLPESVRMIDTGAFAGSGLHQACLTSAKLIAENAFSGCHNLWSVELNATQIGNRAFANCKHLREVKLAEGVLTIGEQAFMNCLELDHLHIPTNVHQFGNQAFANVPKLSVRIPKLLEEHCLHFCPCHPKYGKERHYLFEKAARIHFYEGGI